MSKRLVVVLFIAQLAATPLGAQPAPTPECSRAEAHNCSTECKCAKGASCRCVEADHPFRASLYLGEAIDTFSGAETTDYFNPDESGKPAWRAIGGFDFAYRLTDRKRKYRLWVYGETVHGVRSRDVDCSQTANADLSICKDVLDSSNAEKRFVYILRKATSIEAFTGLRWEMFPLNPTSEDPAWLYVKAQAGFVSLSGGGDVVDMHHVAVGARADAGPFEDSFLEFGYGRDDLFLENRTGRWLVDALLSFPLPWTDANTPVFGSKRLKGFAEIMVDTDLGPGADSVQTYFGFDFILDKHNE